MKALIVDDEQNVREALRALLQLYAPETELIGEASGVEEAKKAIETLQPELLFLDVEMGDGTGFDLLKQLPNRNFEVIFVTAHQHYAIEAIRMSACDFLLKPVDPDDLVEAIERAKTKLVNLGGDPIDVMLQHASGIKDRIVLKDLDSIYVLKIADIIHCEADGRYTRFFVKEMLRPILVSTNLKEYEQLLSPSGFARIHHSHLINLAHIHRIDKVNLTVHLSQAHKVPISVRKKDELMKRL
ncbi:MAG: LytTR family DNA-binding domain-containing protein [Flavobacteriales bacterium]|nr:LytTR family DNA-binding domain-containing protein [Flavobacteriales bacterium]